MGFTQCCICPYLDGLGQMIISYGTRDYHVMSTMIHYLPLQPRRGNRCAQIFATDFGWSYLFPVKLKSEAHEALSLLCQWDRVPSTVICDNAKEIFLGEFNRKLKEALCHLN